MHPEEKKRSGVTPNDAKLASEQRKKDGDLFMFGGAHDNLDNLEWAFRARSMRIAER